MGTFEKLIVVGGVILIAILLLAAWSEKPTYQLRQIHVAEGDTLWKYWTEYGEKMSYGKWIEEVKALNDMSSVTLESWRQSLIIIDTGVDR